MRKSVAIWAIAGLIVAGCWVAIAALAGPGVNLGQSTLVSITAPASLLGRRVPLSVTWFVVLNAVIYALIGLAASAARRFEA